MRRHHVAFTLGLALVAAPAAAHHPGHDLDRVMGSKEQYFEAVDKPAPTFALRDADGGAVRLADLADKVVVLHFIYAGCPDVCPLHAERIAEVQAMVNRTPMRDMVAFVSITTDPANDTPEVMRDYGPAHGLDPVNWRFLTIAPGQAEDATRTLAQAFGHSFQKTDDGYQMHGVVTHVIDRGGRWRANFHGLRFAPLNLVLYVNGLTNSAHAPDSRPAPTFWQRIERMLE
jgi:protein SCO1/2